MLEKSGGWAANYKWLKDHGYGPDEEKDVEWQRGIAFLSRKFGRTGESEMSEKLKTYLVAIDFDGVIHSYRSGWQGADLIPDEPVEGAIRWLIWVSSFKELKLAIYSSRNHQDGGIRAMKDFLLRHLFLELKDRTMAQNILSKIDFPNCKPPAHVIIDDRAIRFDGKNYPDPDYIIKFRNWLDQEIRL